MTDLTGLGAIADLATGVINRIWPDASEAEKSKLTLALAQLNAELELSKAQTTVNVAEASNSSILVSGWRPAVGWCCVTALAYQYIIYPLLLWMMVFNPDLIPPKPIVSDILMELLFGMLGMGTLRSWEKIKGVAR